MPGQKKTYYKISLKVSWIQDLILTKYYFRTQIKKIHFIYSVKRRKKVILYLDFDEN